MKVKDENYDRLLHDPIHTVNELKELKKVMREAYKIVEKLEIKYSLKRQEFLNAIEIEDTQIKGGNMFSSILKKLIPQNIAGIVGLVQSIINTARELIILVIRLLSVIMPKKFNEAMIVKVSTSHGWLNGLIEKAKNFFL